MVWGSSTSCSCCSTCGSAGFGSSGIAGSPAAALVAPSCLRLSAASIIVLELSLSLGGVGSFRRSRVSCYGARSRLCGRTSARRLVKGVYKGMPSHFSGACWHRPRGPSLVEPGLLEEDARCPPHLLVVGDGNSRDPGPARLRQEAKRGARWLMQPIGEEIVHCNNNHRCSRKHRPV